MDTGPLEHRLTLVERQIVDAERHVTLHREVLTRLEQDGLSTSETANIARDDLKWIEDMLRAYNAERKSLQAQRRRQLRTR